MIKKIANIMQHENRLILQGELGFANVMSVYRDGLHRFEKYPELIVDFSNLSACDSAGLALIIEWIKYARTQNKKIVIDHLSKELKSIAKVAGIDQLI